MNKVLIIVPTDIYDIKYPHLFDFISEFKKSAVVDILLIPERGYWIEKYLERIKRTFYKKDTIRAVVRMAKFVLHLYRKRKYHYDQVISIDNLAYIFACRILKGNNHVLWSHDFVSSDNESHTGQHQKKIRDLARSYLLIHKKIIIQSPKRLELFLKSLSLDLQEYQHVTAKYLPVSLKDIELARVRNLDCISRHFVSLIQIGGINQYRSNSCDLIFESQRIDHLKLILHGFISSEVLQYIFENKFLNFPVLSNIDLPGEQIPGVLSNADIGFVSYVANDENFVNIDWASGQIAEHTRAGLPIICHGNTSLNNFVIENNIGVGISHMKDLAEAISKIIVDYKNYSDRSRLLFQDKMNISKLLPLDFK